MGKWRSYLEVGAVVLCNVRTVALTEHRDLLLYVFDLILSLLQIDCLDGDDTLRAVINAFEDLREETGSRDESGPHNKKTKEERKQRKTEE